MQGKARSKKVLSCILYKRSALNVKNLTTKIVTERKVKTQHKGKIPTE